MMINSKVVGWVREISRAQRLYKVELVEEMVEITSIKSGDLVKAFVLDEVYMEDRQTVIEAIVPHFPTSRNWRYELKQKLNGMEKVSFWTHKGASDVIKEAGAAMLEYPVLTIGTLRCTKTGHNVSLFDIDKNMKERKEKGYYD
ncbi:hypothetical protein [Vibrio phage CKB-S2]|nr:hypothetical protein [Vibrio phage CKB-S2]